MALTCDDSTFDGDSFPNLIITIDGPAGTGKSSVGRALANRIGLEFLDTGAMYRAATALALDQGVDITDGPAVARLAADADLHFVWAADPPTLLAHQKPYVTRLRDSDVTSAVSAVASLREVRDVLARKQMLIGRQHPRLVSEGRDQGSVVFPDADVKIYLDASARVRAARRVAQLAEMGVQVNLDDIEREQIARDDADANRPVGPLVCPADAVRVDTSRIEFDDVVDELERVVRTQLAARVNRGT